MNNQAKISQKLRKECLFKLAYLSEKNTYDAFPEL